MPTQIEIAEHLGIDQAAVSRHMASLQLDWRTATMDEVRLAYLSRLRDQAAGHVTPDGINLVQERALTERVDRELKQLQLAEKRGQLVNVAQLEPELSRMFGAFRAELLARDDKLKAALDALHGIDIDLTLLNDHTADALAQLPRYDPARAGFAEAPGDAGGAAGEDGHDAVGPDVSTTVGQGDGAAGDVQP
jgi:DNA-binding MarR family transcriptional regulator